MLPSPPRRRRGGRLALPQAHALLLRATLSDGAPAWRAYREWRSSVDVERLDLASQRSLPLLARSLSGIEHAAGDPFLARCRKVERFTWLKSQLIVNAAAAGVAALVDAGIAVLALKGVAVVHHAGGDLATRPMDDVDVAVAPDLVPEALAALAAVGFHPAGGHVLSGVELERWTRGLHALQLRRPSGAELDLHWHVMASSLNAQADADFWRTAVPASLGGASCLVTAIEHTIVEVIAHAAVGQVDAGLRWATDVVTLDRAAAGRGVDWATVAELARRHRISVQVADALGVLADLFLIDLPPGLEAALRKAPLTARIEAWPRLDRHGAPRLPTSVETATAAYEGHIRASVVPGRRVGLGEPARFLARWWALERLRRVPLHACFVAAGRPWWLRDMLRRAARRPGRLPVATRSGGGPVLGLGDAVRFDLGGEGVRCLGAGWRFPEDHGTWTVSREAVVDLRLAAGLGPVVLQAKLISFLCPGRQRMRVDVALDEALAARWCFRGDRSQESIERIELPASSGAAIRPLRLRFVIHDPLSPAAAGVDSTAVAIGISLAEISLQPRQEHRELAAEPGAL